jgi:uncharacterized protein
VSVRTLRELVDEHRGEILDLARRHGAHDVRLIGSVARGDETPASDIDFVVKFEVGRSVFDQAGLVHDLQRLLGGQVDVVSEGGLRDHDPILLGATRL